MELSQLEKDLIQLFKAYEMDKDEVIGTMLMLKNKDNQNQMYKWIENNTAATIEEVINEAERLYKNL